MAENFTQGIIKKQLATRSGQIGITANNGTYQFVNTVTGQILPTQQVDANLLANPQRPNDPKLTNRALTIARSYFTDPATPSEFIEAIASVAAYVSVTNGIPVDQLFANQTISMNLISAYNNFKPKSSQVGVFVGDGNPAWVNNPTLRGSIAAAITDQP